MSRSYIDTLTTLVETTEEEQIAMADAAAEEQYARENKVQALIKAACQRMRLQVADHNYAISYSEDDNREATVDCYESVTLEQLQAFSTFATNISVSANASHRDVIEIKMTIQPGIEDATLAEGFQIEKYWKSGRTSLHANGKEFDTREEAEEWADKIDLTGDVTGYSIIPAKKKDE